MFFQQSCLSNKTVNMCVLELCFVTFLFYDLNYPKCCHICTNKQMNGPRGWFPFALTHWHSSENSKGRTTHGYWNEFLASFYKNPRFSHKYSKSLIWQLRSIAQRFTNWFRDSWDSAPYYACLIRPRPGPPSGSFSLPSPSHLSSTL